MATPIALLAYLDPGNGDTGPTTVQWVLYVAAAAAVTVVAVYALTRLVVWASSR